MSKISKLKLQDFEDSETYDVINRARNESEGKVSSLSIFSGKVIFKDMMLI